MPHVTKLITGHIFTMVFGKWDRLRRGNITENYSFLNRRSRSNEWTWIVCHMREFRDHLVFHATQKRVVSVSFPFLLSSLSRSPRRHAPQFFRVAQFFFSPQQYSFPAAWYRLPLLNSIRHDTLLFLEAFRHRNRLDECGGTAIVQKSCFSGRTMRYASVYPRMHDGRGDFPFSRREKYSRARHELRSLSSLAN